MLPGGRHSGLSLNSSKMQNLDKVSEAHRCSLPESSCDVPVLVEGTAMPALLELTVSNPGDGERMPPLGKLVRINNLLLS